MKKVVGWTAWCMLGSAVGYLIAGRTSVAIGDHQPSYRCLVEHRTLKAE